MRLPTLLLTTVYLAALCLALRDPSDHALAGAVVLAGLAIRWAARGPGRTHPVVLGAGRLWLRLPAEPPGPAPVQDDAVPIPPSAPARTGTAPA
ncbi:hypothetical protein OF117_14340 [Geodermatophilus sp. YIM 151500]|uniref:hypothetical protein n=1 Tax=Geodermatophilus sp. YIM 151500 TaxID=2984531 RepID=UPI0021E3E321|nr:hypothetical protein [Geodermatophilus sp. YIM 151500]MCV2490538.1 hypothetical protein [Geodermatophilus sp. YIM 151500]